MLKKLTLVAFIACLLTLQSAFNPVLAAEAAGASTAVPVDHRQLVPMPAEARQLMRKDMLDHLLALNEIIGHLAQNQLAAAAAVAESRMGKSSMGKHRGSGMGPGRFMPPEMRSIGWAMHDAASELAAAATQGELQQTQQALNKITASCVACHYAFRTR